MRQHPDDHCVLPFLDGKKAGAPHDILLWKHDDKGAVREGDWKLLISQGECTLQLFNLAEDIGEKSDRAGEKLEMVQRLHKAWLDWSATHPPRASTQAPRK